MRLSWGALVVMLLARVLGITIPIRSADSFSFTPIDVPGATWTEANGITDAGQIVGTFTDAAFGPRGRALPPPWHGFVTAQ